MPPARPHNASTIRNELQMIVKRRTWLYRLPGQTYAQLISFDQPVTASKAREEIRRTVGEPSDLWGRDKSVPLPESLRYR